MFERFLNSCLADPDSARFAKYLNDNYRNNIKSWAYCFRLHSGLNTNMHLERMHKTIKYLYLKGKHNKRLDKAIFYIMKFVRDKLFDRLITLNKGKLTSKLKDLRSRHKKSYELDTSQLMKVDGTWQILSLSSKNPEFYQIYDNIENCDCQLFCSDCKICIHRYSCSCLDSSIRWNFCKHLHLLGRKLLDLKNLDDAKHDIGKYIILLFILIKNLLI